MRCALPLLILLTTGAVRAADAPKPNTLTPKEIADGWVLLFDGATSFGWKVDGVAKVEGGKWGLGGDRATEVRTTTVFGSFDLEVKYTSAGKEAPSLKLGQADYKLPNEEHLIRVAIDANELFFKISIKEADPKVITEFTTATLQNSHHAATVGFAVPGGCQLKLVECKLRPKGLTSIFNGKDLSGWKRYTGGEKQAKSIFSITPEGWLNVTNGPGDLQTVRQWKDFVFQGECLSNGEHLNSGIFFRCRPGEYQNGYEMQIRNQWQGDDRTKPVDFGTGAIYRRQPARKVVSSDHEWFTMTLVADGNHFATWVNGYQVTDWTDTRPENANARSGLKLGAGPLSIQGHDPTTNLSFRNLRVAELPAKK
jgi:hypothetical protein